jgi:hypothetical protein
LNLKNNIAKLKMKKLEESNNNMRTKDYSLKKSSKRKSKNLEIYKFLTNT